MKQCIKSLLTLDCGLTEAEVIQIANACPQSDVEFYLVAYLRPLYIHMHIHKYIHTVNFHFEPRCDESCLLFRYNLGPVSYPFII